MKLSRVAVGTILGVAVVWSHAQAQDAPTPRRMPREPVSRQILTTGKPAMPPSRTVAGTATIVDPERLRIDDVEMRLFGIVPPQLSASYGPQARAVLDGLSAAGSVSCTIRDRDRDGRFLATCHAVDNSDLALALLKRGLAVTARGSLQPTELAAPYAAAEQAAQAGRLGLWSVALPTAVSEANIRETAAKEAAAKEAAAKEAAAKEAAAKAEAAKADKPAQPTAASDKDAKTPIVTPVTPEAAVASVAVAAPSAPPAGSLLERYQFLITGLLMFLTTLGILGAVVWNRVRDGREELRSIAAALRGELMAARAVCQSRLRALPADADDKQTVWPRIRVLVFQAYVGRLGRLGAELARQVASIYGQASDYAAYYNAAQNADMKFEPVSKRQAMQTLAQHIEEVLPRLASIEQSGKRIAAGAKPLAIAHSLTPLTPPLGGPGSAVAPMSAISFTPSEKPADKTPSPESKSQDSVEAESEPKPTAKAEETTPPAKPAETAMATAIEALAEVIEPVETAPSKKETDSSPALWGAIRKFATERMERVKKDPMDDLLPDYAAMTDEEMESLVYDRAMDEDYPLPAKARRAR